MRFLVIYQSVGGQCGWFSKGCPICNEFIERSGLKALIFGSKALPKSGLGPFTELFKT